MRFDNPESRYYDPTVTVTDIEVWLGVSYATAKRRMAEMKKKLGIARYQKPTREVAKRYFRIDK